MDALEMMACPECGTLVDEQEVVCPQCGLDLVKAQVVEDLIGNEEAEEWPETEVDEEEDEDEEAP